MRDVGDTLSSVMPVMPVMPVMAKDERADRAGVPEATADVVERVETTVSTGLSRGNCLAALALPDQVDGDLLLAQHIDPGRLPLLDGSDGLGAARCPGGDVPLADSAAADGGARNAGSRRAHGDIEFGAGHVVVFQGIDRARPGCAACRRSQGDEQCGPR